MTKKTIVQAAPNLNKQSQIEFRKNDFDAAVELKGLDVLWESAIKCPCADKALGKGVQVPDCQNCLGTGWVYINRIQTKMILQSMNANTIYKDWTEEKTGNVSITARSVDRLNFMDRVTLNEDTSVLSELRSVRVSDDNVNFMFASYPPIDIIEIFAYDGPTVKLNRVIKEFIQISGYNIIITDPDVTEGMVLTVRYHYRTQYVVLDLPKEVRSSSIIDLNGARKKIDLPISAMARRVHDHFDAPDYDGFNVIDNSYH
jgi:hypothetical protein